MDLDSMKRNSMPLIVFGDRSISILRMNSFIKYFLFCVIFILCISLIWRSSSISEDEDDDHVEKKSIPYNGILGISMDDVIAYSNGNDQYFSNESHYLNKIYLGVKWQCVEYARRWTYLRKSSTFESIPGAKDIWTNVKFIENVFNGKKYFLKHHSNGSPSPPINGTYLIYPSQNEMPYGHVAIILQVLSNSIRIAEQNFNFHQWKSSYAREIPLRILNGSYWINDIYQVYGWIEILDPDEQLKPLKNFEFH